MEEEEGENSASEFSAIKPYGGGDCHTLTPTLLHGNLSLIRPDFEAIWSFVTCVKMGVSDSPSIIAWQ